MRKVIGRLLDNNYSCLVWPLNFLLLSQIVVLKKRHSKYSFLRLDMLWMLLDIIDYHSSGIGPTCVRMVRDCSCVLYIHSVYDLVVYWGPRSLVFLRSHHPAMWLGYMLCPCAIDYVIWLWETPLLWPSWAWVAPFGGDPTFGFRAWLLAPRSWKTPPLHLWWNGTWKCASKTKTWRAKNLPMKKHVHWTTRKECMLYKSTSDFAEGLQL